MRKKLDFGKVDYLGIGRKTCPVTVEIALTERGGESSPRYLEFTASGMIWNHKHTDCYTGGQCLDTIAKYVRSARFREVYDLWKKYHLNGMHAGTPEQEAALTKYKAEIKRDGILFDYRGACNFLESRGLLDVPFYGRTTSREWSGELYHYGSGWVIQDIPEADIERIKSLFE